MNKAKNIAFTVLAIAVLAVMPATASAQEYGGAVWGDATDIGSYGGDLGGNQGYGAFNDYGGAVWGDATPIDQYTSDYGGAVWGSATPVDQYGDEYGGAVWGSATPIDQYGGTLGANQGYGAVSPSGVGYTMTPEYSTTGGYSMTPEYSTTGGYSMTPEYSVTDTYSTSAEYQSTTYSAATPYYSTGCNCYSSSPYSNVPTYATQYIPSYVYQPMPTSPSRPQPTYSVATTPAPTYNTNTNANTNTNVNNPTAVATATNGDNVNTNVASTGAITNNFAPVINVGSSGSTHRPADYQLPRPVCTIYASNNYNNYSNYNHNSPVTLTWSSQNANSAYISPNVGSVSTNGSRTVYPSGYTTYTLTVTGAGGSDTCQTVANYAPTYSVAPTYPVAATPAPYVSLSQIPYTGFDYGPVGNAIYWTAILSFAVAAGYLLVYGMPKFALAGFGRSSRAGKQENAFSDASVQEVFKQTIVPSTEIKEEKFDLPVAASSHAGLTSDAMIIDHSNGTPRIVIARA